jgi:hypothetical protein
VNQSSVRGALDFGTISNQLRILRISPAWEVVRASLARLERIDLQKQSSRARLEDVQLISQFAGLLRKESQTIGLALLSGAVLGQAHSKASEVSAGVRLVAGLRTMSSALRFSQVSGEELLHEVLWLCEQLKNRRGIDLAAYIPASLASDISEYEFGLTEGLNAAREVSIVLQEEDRKVAWNSTLSRLEAYFTGAQPQRPNLEEILSSLAEVSPGSLIGFDLEAMTLKQWSTVFVKAVASGQWSNPQFAPRWMAAASLKALGFWFPDVWQIGSWLMGRGDGGGTAFSPTNDHANYSQYWLSSSAAERSVFVVCEETSTMTHHWKPATRSAAIATTAVDFLTIADQGLFKAPNFPGLPPFHVLAIEELPENRPSTLQSPWVQLVERKIITNAGELLDNSLGNSQMRVIRFFHSAPQTPPTGEYIVGPQTVDDLFPVGVGPQLAR